MSDVVKRAKSALEEYHRSKPKNPEVTMELALLVPELVAEIERLRAGRKVRPERA